MNYKETVSRDSNHDGVFDSIYSTLNECDVYGRIDYSTLEKDEGGDGTIDTRETVDLLYDAVGLLSGEVLSTDYGADGSIEWNDYRSLTYDANSRISTDRHDSPDLDGDGQPEYSDVTSYTYDANSRVTAKETIYSFNGTPNGVDYHMESFYYNAKGLLSEHYTDDWSLYDNIVGKKYTYNSSNQVTKVQTQDEYTFNDTNWHTAETYKYSGGRLVEQNDYATYMNGMYVLEDKAKFTYNGNGLVSKEKHTGQDGSWHTITGYQDEFWYDSLGRLDTQLTSLDIDGNGVFEAGTRTLQEWAYNDDGFGFTHTVDEMTGDSIMEYSFTSELLVA